MDNRIELCKCGHDRFMHDCKEYECLVHECSCTLYSEPVKQVVCPKCHTKGTQPTESDCYHIVPHIQDDGCKICKTCIPVPSTPASEMVCKCGHSLAEHYEGGGDVTYCEHSDCACKVFVLLPPDELLKFNNVLEADALDWDTRNIEPQPKEA